MNMKRKTLARRLTGRISLWAFVIALGLSCFLFYFERIATREFYSEIYLNKMLVTNEYTRRVLSDVHVAVINNIYYLEHSLDNPDGHKETMARIVKSGTRVRSCGISFIKDYYYPQKGHRYCPYAWRNSARPDEIYTQDMGDEDLDYVNQQWFIDIVKKDSVEWSDPFYNGYFAKTPLSAYMAPIHDQDGRVVAIIGADISFDWLTNKLNETDSVINKESMLIPNRFRMKSYSFLVNHDGTLLTHTTEKTNFFTELEPCDGSDVNELIGMMQEGKEPENMSRQRYLVNGQECYIFYIPVKYTRWLMVSVVPCRTIDMLGYLNAGTTILSFLVALLILLAVVYNYLKNATEPLKLLTGHVDNIVKGRYDAPIPEVEHNDEIAQLRDAIEEMQFSLSNYAENANR